MARSASLTTAPAEAPPTLSKSQPPVLPIAPQRTSTVPTSSSKRYRALRSPTTSICRPAAPLHSIPETPKDLDVAPEGSWALRCWPEGSSKLMQSRSAPNMKVSKRSVGPEGLKRSLSGLDVDRGDGSDSKKHTSPSLYRCAVVQPHSALTLHPINGLSSLFTKRAFALPLLCAPLAFSR